MTHLSARFKKLPTVDCEGVDVDSQCTRDFLKGVRFKVCSNLSVTFALWRCADITLGLDFRSFLGYASSTRLQKSRAVRRMKNTSKCLQLIFYMSGNQ